MDRKRIVLVALMVLGCASNAWALSRGSSMFAVEFTDGTADLADYFTAGTTEYIRAHSMPEIGIQGQYWYMAAEDYAVTVSFGIGTSKEIAKPGDAAPALATEITVKSSAFNVRLGGDRVVKVGDRTVMYGGPGIEYWMGKGKYENIGIGPTGDYEGENSKRISLSSRIGATMQINSMTGLTAHIGHRLGHASAEQDGAKTTWWPSSFEGSMGLIFNFGGAR